MLIRYRWELWLLAGIPLAYWIVQSLALSLFSAFSYALSSYHTTHLVSSGIASLGTAVLLGASYPYVRRLGRDLLPLVWGYSIAAAAIAAAVNIGSGFLAPEDYATFEAVRWNLVVAALHGLVELPVLLWFARQASRFSLLHAFFLALIAVFTGPLVFPSGASVSLSFSFDAFIYLAMTLLLVWLLGNFESRGYAFRRRTVVTMSVLGSVGALKAFHLAILLQVQREPEVLITILFTVLAGAAFVVIALALAYLVRVRRPAVEAEA